MSRTIRLTIEDDPDEIEITIQSASEERANDLATEYLLPVVRDLFRKGLITKSQGKGNSS